MKLIIKALFLVLPLLLLSPQLFAQEPDPMPIPSLSEEEKEIISFQPLDDLEEEEADPGDKTFNFCGQDVNLEMRERRIRLRRELQVISRFSNVLLQRSGYFFPIIEPILRENDIPEDFKYLMVIESAMNPYARSNKGAAGLWQFMEGTAQDYGLTVNRWVDERYHLEKATAAACRYLNDAYRRFGDWVAVAQSYNIGQGRISKELNSQKVDEALDLNLVEETNRYVYRIFAAKLIFTSPDTYGLTKPMPYYNKIRVPARQKGQRRM